MHLHPLLPPSPLHHHPPLQGLRRLDLVVVGTVDCLFIDFLFFGGKMQVFFDELHLMWRHTTYTDTQFSSDYTRIPSIIPS